MYPAVRISLLSALAGLALATFGTAAQAVEYPIGTPQQRYGMEIAAVYLQPVTMEPDGMMKKAEESDVHMEADIHALANNPNGFEEGAWIPYLVVKYEVTKVGGSQKISGDFMPMVANDGPHYGDNFKLMGPGEIPGEAHHPPPQRQSPQPFRPPHRPPDGCAPLVQAFRSGI